MHLKWLLFITGRLAELWKPPWLIINEPTFSLLCPPELRGVWCSSGVGCPEGVLLHRWCRGHGVMWLLWCVFMAAVSAGHTLCSLGWNEYGKACRSVQQRREWEGLVFHSWLPSDSLFSCSLNCQTACILSEKVTTFTCVKLILTATCSHMIDISDMLRIIIISLRLLPVGVGAQQIIWTDVMNCIWVGFLCWIPVLIQPSLFFQPWDELLWMHWL